MTPVFSDSSFKYKLRAIREDDNIVSGSAVADVGVVAETGVNVNSDVQLPRKPLIWREPPLLQNSEGERKRTVVDVL